MDIKGKVGIITGATGGIGSQIVNQLLENEIKFIALFDLDNVKTRKKFDDLKQIYGNRVGFFSCDVTKTAELAENFDQVLKIYPTVDILINNAGIIHEDEPEKMIDMNYKAVVLGSLMFINRFGKHKGGKGGVIVNTASIAGLVNLNLPIYCSTKHAVVSFTYSMAEQYKTTGVRVVAICPGVTVTPLLDDIPRGLDFINNDRLLEPFPVQQPDNVAKAFIKIIQKGESGDVWVSEKNEAPYSVRDVENHEDLKIEYKK
ncbi:hypothetical protein QAD02_023680 [Eretmocerus hayati]|uniref:Uncharacterized protein n=1 Tax=Eretmocerus hayati TaxID=131215 RepID=A0ACC2Q1F1_9HYME|nr:hypothetical protein QAD02_023680 [Eretmocerus hayati]